METPNMIALTGKFCSQISTDRCDFRTRFERSRVVHQFVLDSSVDVPRPRATTAVLLPFLFIGYWRKADNGLLHVAPCCANRARLLREAMETDAYVQQRSHLV